MLKESAPTLGSAVVGLTAVAWVSRSWSISGDSPILAYVAMAIDRFGYAPYRDLFDFNAPGAYLANIAIGRLFGYTESGFRIADLTYLTALLGVTAITLRRFGLRVAIAGPVLFGYFYLGYGSLMSLQREYLLLLPVAASLFFAFAAPLSTWVRAFVIGLLMGIAATIKPQAAGLLPVFVVWLIWNEGSEGYPLGRPRRGRVVQTLASATAGFLIPIAAVFTWLWSIGSLDAFLDIARNYWPLYEQLTGARPHRIVQGFERAGFLAQRFILSRDLRHLIVVPALVGTWVALRRSGLDAETRRKVVLLAGVAFALQLYPLAAGKFWGYHWLPSFYAASLLAGLCFAPQQVRGDTPSGVSISRAPRDLASSMLVVMVTAQAPGILRFVQEARADVVVGPWTTATQIADELRERIQPGDVVQPLDWTAGAVHALWLTETRVATPFLYDFHFYHHVSSPYIQNLRTRLMTSLRASRPAFVVTADQTERLYGPDTTDRFEPLEEWLARDYRLVAGNERFGIYEQIDLAGRSARATISTGSR